MDIKLFFGIVSTIIAVVCFIPYFKDIFKRKTQPHMYSWLVWGSLQVVGTVAHLKDGAGYGAWALAVGAFFCFLIFLLSFKYGTKNIKKFDIVCLIFAFTAFLLYCYLDNPLWSILIVSIVDFLGFLPTFRKGYQEPNTETVSTFAMSATANFLSLLALQNYSLTTIIYIVSLFITNASFVIMILLRRKSFK